MKQVNSSLITNSDRKYVGKFSNDDTRISTRRRRLYSLEERTINPMTFGKHHLHFQAKLYLVQFFNQIVSSDGVRNGF